MIPPVVPGQSEEKQNMVGWKNTFNMRQISLMNLAASQIGIKNGTKSSIPNYRRAYSVTSPAKSLDLLRRNLQNAINKDIDNVIKKYIEKFFQPAINNIKSNLGKDSVGEDHIKEVCKQMLEEAKSMYSVTLSSRDSSPYEYSQSEADSETSTGDGRLERTLLFLPTIKRHRNKAHNSTDYSSCKLSLKRDGPKWNPDRVKGSTLFIMGARANKVLGYGQTRGRLYVRHPNLVRYSGDQEDKEWLASKNLMPPSGGKAYLMLLEDIKELTESDEYKHSPNLQLHELKGFEVPMFLLLKIKNFIEYVRTERKLLAHVDIYEDQSHSSTPPCNVALDSAPSTPSDTTVSVENPIDNFKQDNFLNISDMSSSSVVTSIFASHLSTVNSTDSSQDF
ncbi:hypothetical protein NQ315_013811 [Exocentrus adspersus]|uniref:Deoxynucleotidyltransferase terminal-interacting protein 1 n=1 Tax=Exocentrus adspersus TaxID=1586481 RepID=A0AAV8VBG8_9CUCU|nr:hypothetical protein NQ315_013811 [Exocentrus adspersus]